MVIRAKALPTRELSRSDSSSESRIEKEVHSMARIGIIGTGWGARVQVPMFREAGLDVIAIAGHSREKTEKIANELGVRAIAKWRDLIVLDLDLVTLVTPPAEHLEMASAAIAAGKHVICEKPTALTAH